ncbi:MAG TPA: acetylglutamate kinase [Candidatus Methanomethylophilaceae archaeon]|nr:acetylglutamate kinase [Candidatus Methanomethylophilaceae archaeon]
MLYLIKFGGNAISGAKDLARLCDEIGEMTASGSKVILVHGGGPEISDEMEKAGLRPEKINGVRITDHQGLEVVERVLSSINTRVTDALDASDVPNIGMPALECTKCRRIAPVNYIEDGIDKVADMGLVGEVESVHEDRLRSILDEGKVPVIYPIGSDGTDKLNVNADTMAAGIAAAMRCDEMIAITDVPGVLRDIKDPSSKYDKLTIDEVYALIEDGTISGGMIPKVEACINTVRAGARAVRMVSGKGPGKIVSDAAEANRGTVITE